MKEGHPFSDERVLRDMLALRTIGWTYKRIAAKYEVHHTTIIYHCQRYNVVAPNTKPRKRRNVPKRTLSLDQLITLRRASYCFDDGERINPGKPSYRAYLLAEKQKKQRKRGLPI